MTGVAGHDRPSTVPTPSDMRIALLGDLHDYCLAAWPWELLGKPLAGQVNLWLNRRRRFDRSLIAPLIGRVVATDPDIALFSGDLTTTSRPREFASIATKLQPLLAHTGAVIVPGNHDRYTRLAERSRRLERAFPGLAPEVFPQTRSLIGRWRLLAVNAATPRFFDSRGRIGGRQMQHVQAVLRSLTADDGVVVLCHYPFAKPPQLPPMTEGHRLLDEAEWRGTLRDCRARMIIVHGHVHCPWLWRPTDMPRTLDVNAGAPAMVGGGWPKGQGFWIMNLSADPAQPIMFEHHVAEAGEAPVGMTDAPVRSDDGWIVRSIAISL